MERFVRGRVYTIDIPPQFRLRTWPATFRFCVEATDPSANTGAASCARFRFLKRR